MKRSLLLLFFLIIIILFIISGMRCNNTETEDFEEKYRDGLSEIGVIGLQTHLDKFDWPDDIVQRGQQAAMQWENNKCDPVPIIIYARVEKHYDNVCRIGLYYSDEDSDVVGFGVREKRIDENDGDVIVEEIYPVFYHSSPPAVWQSVFEFEERDSGNRKNEESWKDFIEKSPSEVRPSIITSIPVSDDVEVWVWVYDRAGNQSEPIKAVDGSEVP